MGLATSVGPGPLALEEVVVTERKPAEVSWQTWIDRQIEEGRRAGAFDDLPGHGKPIADIDRPRDELWWVKAKLRREEVDHLPPSLAIRRDRDAALARAMAAPTAVEARTILEGINEKIRYLNSHVTSGPPTTVAPLDVDELLDRWRAVDRPPDARSAEPAQTRPASTGRRPRLRWRR